MAAARCLRFILTRGVTISLNLLVAVPHGDGFRYEYYGSALTEVTGIDRTNSTTADFSAEASELFRSRYQEALVERRPILTVHNAAHDGRPFRWERLILPVHRQDASEDVLVCFSWPVDQRADLFDGLMRTSVDAIMILSPVFAPQTLSELPGGRADQIEDFRVVLANPRAHELAQLADGSLIGASVKRIGLCGEEIGLEVYQNVWNSGEPGQFHHEIQTAVGLVHLRVSATRADDRILAVMTDVSAMKESELRLKEQQANLMYSNEILEQQAQSLAEIAEDREAAVRLPRMLKGSSQALSRRCLSRSSIETAKPACWSG